MSWFGKRSGAAAARQGISDNAVMGREAGRPAGRRERLPANWQRRRVRCPWCGRPTKTLSGACRAHKTVEAMWQEQYR